MTDFNSIGWCHYTRGYWSGCTELSPACDNCYARIMLQDRFKRVLWGSGQERIPSFDNATKGIAAIARKAKRDGVRYRIFINSASDTFDAEVPDEWRHRIFEDARKFPEVDFLLLTKRPKVALNYWRRYMMLHDGTEPEDNLWPRNVWLGVTVESPQYLWRLDCMPPAPVRFVSMEPMVEPFGFDDIRRLTGSLVDWVIVGGERGKDARPIDLDNVRRIQDACRRKGKAFYFKQVSGFNPNDAMIPEDLRVREFPKAVIL